MFCHKCGAQAIDGAKFCQKCGAKLIKDDEKQSPIETERAQTGEAIPLWKSTPEPVQESAKTQNTSTETKSDSTKQPSPTVHTETAQETDSFVEQMVASVFPPKTEKHVESVVSAEPGVSTEPTESTEPEPIATSKRPIDADAPVRSETAPNPMPHTEEESKQIKNEQGQEAPHGNVDPRMTYREEIYKTLVDNISSCPTIKSAKRIKQNVRFRGKCYRYAVSIVPKPTVRARMRTVLRFPLSGLYVLLTGLLCIAIGVISQELLKYGSFCIEWYHGVLFALCSLAAGAVVFIHSFVGRKEKAAVTDYICEILVQKHIYLQNRNEEGMFRIKVALAIILIAVGIIALPLSIPAPMDYPDEILFAGLPATRFLEMTQDDLEREFGKIELTAQNGITGDDYYGNLEAGILHVVYSKYSGKIIYIELFSDYCSYNRKNLYKSMPRVDDILCKDDSYSVLWFPQSVYGSIHSGFYYQDGVYTTNIAAQWEFEHSQSHYYKFYSAIPFEKKESNLSGLIEPANYRISLIYHIWETSDGSNEASELMWVCLYTDEWVDTLNRASAFSKLSQEYVNEDEGLSFQYPDDWTVDEEFIEGNPSVITYIRHPSSSILYEYDAGMIVSNLGSGIDEDELLPLGDSDFQEFIESSENIKSITSIEVTDVTLDGHFAKKVTYAALNIDDISMIVVGYFYIVNTNLYLVEIVSTATFKDYEPIFDAIMETYTITAETSGKRSSDVGTGNPANGNLSMPVKTYSSESEPITFCYPDDWFIASEDVWTEDGVMIVAAGSESGAIQLIVNMMGIDSAYDVFSDNWEDVSEGIGKYFTVLDFWDTTIDGKPMRVVEFENEFRYFRTYWYASRGGDVYKISCSYLHSELIAEEAEPIFDMILDSFTI